MYLYGFVLQVGVIRPILSRDYDSTRAAAKDAAKAGSKEQSVTQHQQVNRNNKANKVDKELHQDNKKLLTWLTEHLNQISKQNKP